MKNVWVKIGNTYRMSEISQQTESLSPGIYKLEVEPITENVLLKRTNDSFSFPYKIYGLERPFIDRVKKSYYNTDGNFGIILNGVKGTGKTVTAEIICNEINLPVIIITQHHPGIISFLNNLQQDVIVFIDEYEKIYNGYDNSLLSIMDGVLKTKNRKLFIFTTNELHIERNLLQRPSRIRYIKSFNDMELSVIMEIVNDLLIHKHLFSQTVKMISELPIITMDLVKCIVQEVNIHEEDPENFKSIFNIGGEENTFYDVYEIKEDGEKELIESSAAVTPVPNNIGFKNSSIGYPLYINSHFYGNITSLISDYQVVVEYSDIIKDSHEDDDRLLLKPIEKETPKKTIYFIKPVKRKHSSFTTYVF